jgi:protoporphyrinogen oxidase
MDFFSGNYDYDIIIVGGGISGLFTAYKLSKTNLKILLIESQEELGGRVHTIYKTDYYYECGAARFHKKHSKLLALINELGLKEKIEPLPNKVNYYLRNNGNYNSDENLDLKELLKEAILK